MTFTVDGIEAAAVQEQLASQRINVHTSSQGSTLLDMQRRGLTKLVRASVHYYNTEEEIDRLVGAVASLR